MCSCSYNGLAVTKPMQFDLAMVDRIAQEIFALLKCYLRMLEMLLAEPSVSSIEGSVRDFVL